MIDERLTLTCAKHPYPLLFATVSGAHLYGFPSPDSDYDLRGVHILPLKDMLGLDEPLRTVEASRDEDGLELDLVTHDIEKFFRLLLKRNGYVLEQLYSPLIVHSTPEHEELKAIACGCITRHHVHHYLGFAETQWALFTNENPSRVKPLLYVYRVLLTGIRLIRTGVVEANLAVLNEEFRLPFIDELIELKRNNAERTTLAEHDASFHVAEYQRLREMLASAAAGSSLPEAPTCRDGLNDLLLRIRLQP